MSFFPEFFKRKFSAGRNFCCNTGLPHLSTGDTSCCLSSSPFHFWQTQGCWAPRTQPADAAGASLGRCFFWLLVGRHCVSGGGRSFLLHCCSDLRQKKRQSRHAVLELKKTRNFAGYAGNLALLSPSR